MKILKAKRAVIKGTITRVSNFVSSMTENVSSADCQLRLERLETAWLQYQDIHEAMLEKSEDPESMIEDTDFADCESKYFELKAILMGKIKYSPLETNDLNRSLKQLADQHTELMGKMSLHSARVDQKLPSIVIKTFTGDLSDWITFHDLFVSSVHNNTHLTPSQKFHYLKSFLDGEAAGLLKHTLISDSTYLIAWEKLNTRYNKKGLIASSLVKKLLSLPSVSNSTSLRKLTDEADELLRGLKSLGSEAECRDVILIHIISNKLDCDTLQKWADVSHDTDFPEVNNFFKFLEQRCASLEVYQDSTKIKSNPKPHLLKSYLINCEKFSCINCSQPHELNRCPQFLAFDLEQRRLFVKESQICFNCLRSGHKAVNCNSKFRCRQCNGRHHTLVHPSLSSDSSPVDSQTSLPSTSSGMSSYHNRVSVPASSNLLPTALVLAPNSLGHLQACRILLDSGSQASFISESCVRRLGLTRHSARFSLNGVCGAIAGCTRGKISTSICSRFNHKSIHIDAYILSKLTEPLPTHSFNCLLDSDAGHMGEIADPGFNIRAPVDIILGIDYVFNIIESAPVRGKLGFPDALLTIFGWVFGGNITATCSDSTASTLGINHVSLDMDLQKFWEVEENLYNPFETTSSYSKIEDHFSTTHSRSSDGKFVVELPFRSNQLVDYGDSFSGALRRLLSNERRFEKNPDLQKMYCSFMSEYINLGHMKEIPIKDIVKSKTELYYLPHHPVFKADSTTTKIRVVFDGSHKSGIEPSLNETLEIGPPIQRDLFAVLLRFRRHKYTISGDIEKMFRQIWVANKHVDFQRILWRATSTEPIRHYQLLTVTYGTSCAPYLSIRTLHQLAINSSKKYPVASNIILNDFYVDDLLSGADTVEELLKLHQDLTDLLGDAGFNLRKWSSNCRTFLETLPDKMCEHSTFEYEFFESIKLLGLLWSPSRDSFLFKVSLPDRVTCTKRQILSDTARVFDPLGFLTPSIIALKIIFQQLWRLKLNWDDIVPTDISQDWLSIRSELPLLQGLEIHRRIWLSDSVEYHGFCDASLKAYSAVIYSRSKMTDGSFVTSLVAAKSRVAPIKELTIPRLELCGAVLLSKLFSKLKSSLQDESLHIHAWTDSQIVLHWLLGHSSRWATFIANRVGEITSIIPTSSWKYIPSKSNPADCASRGIRPSKLKEFELWWSGPSWLAESSDQWPDIHGITLDSDFPEPVLELRKSASINVLHVANHLDDDLIDRVTSRSSSYIRIIRIISFCFRFVCNCRLPSTQRNSNSLSTIEIQSAKTFLFTRIQKIFFPTEVNNIIRHQPLHSKSKIVQLTPFIDTSGLLRVGGRIQHSSLKTNVKHPIILPKNHLLVFLLVRYYHEMYLHVGTAELFSILRRQYWILGCRNLVRKVVYGCVVCAKQRKTTCSQLMGSLPEERVTFAMPFDRVGVDFAGPITLRLARGRRPTYIKAYISLFVCFVTKAMHLELVGALSTEAFLAALNRFVARRGKPTIIFSDNGTNFRGAYRKLTEMHSLLLSEYKEGVIADHLSKDGISWQFIPPSSPHFGGLWEAGVRSVKLHLRRVIGDHILTYEEFYTLLTRIEALLNSRPLCARSDDDIDALTPAHFLIGRPFTSISESTLTEINPNLLSNWQKIQHLAQGFWKRWHSEYLTSLQNRPKSRRYCNPQGTTSASI